MTPYEALRGGAAWVDLSERGKIRVTGEDRARLLHAMSTNHIEGLQPGDGLYAFFLNAQGRILADAFVYDLGEAVLLDTEPEIADKLLEHLDKYIIADDVTLKDETDHWTAIGLEGPKSLERAAFLGLPVPEKQYGWVAYGKGFVVRVSGATPDGLRIFLPSEDRKALIDRLNSTGIPQAGADETRTVRLENGIPRYGEDIWERFLVHETQALHAVHFNKGCYLGQEIVERVRSRGQVHRLLSPVRIKVQQPVAPGTKLMAGDTAAAEVTSSAYSPALGQVVGLAYVRAEALQNKPPLTVAESAPPIEAYLP
jgi:folate-binding protein YgfZ